jgi:deoxyribodipyrimidine photolyase-related protein
MLRQTDAAGTGLGRAAPGALRLVLGDQLSRGLASLADLDPARDVVLMVEVADEARYVRHHKQKIVFLLSAMRHFAEALQAEGVRVDYVRLDDPGNTHGFSGEVARAVARHAPERLVLTEPGEWRVAQMMRGWQGALPCPVEIRPDDRFLCSIKDFAALTAAGKTGRMEYFYREMRRRTGLLMAGAKPVGGAWNLDRENRKPMPRGTRPPRRLRFAPNAVTQQVMALVAARFPDHFGDIEPFGWAVTREGALQALAHFLDDCLPQFGDYQDAMKAGEDFLYHGLISPYLNAGLLTADEVCRAAEARWQAGAAPLNAVEGFIRQILGWREYVRGIYWTRMPGYAATNHLEGTRDLPALYWTGRTKMRCLAECVGTTQRHAYAHHIQRLMVLGNFALLAGVEPAQLEAWFLAVYADAYEWVELPNVHGMVLHADGGVLGSKPYAASGAYINRMSDYCRGCAYDPGKRLGDGACPFNAMYWAFLDRHEGTLGRNMRMAHPYRMLRAMPEEERAACVRAAGEFLDGLDREEPDQPRLDAGWKGLSAVDKGCRE